MVERLSSGWITSATKKWERKVEEMCDPIFNLVFPRHGRPDALDSSSVLGLV